VKRILLILSVVCLIVNLAWARVIYVEGSWLGVTGTGTAYDPYGDLQHAIDEAQNSDTLIVKAGVYSAKPEPYTEELCGNCQDHRTSVNASRGFLIEGKALILRGEDAAKTTLITSAGYGVLFQNSRGSRLENVTITKGKRDPDGNATDAGIVAKFSTVTVSGVIIRDNSDRADSVVVGIGGIFGRENSELTIERCLIYNNGWDGITLYRGAVACISDNTIRDGRGVGIGLTWDAAATVLRNRISGYWKGIGTFGASRAIVSNNLVTDCLGWGIIATGDSYLDAINNNVLHNGNSGMVIWSETCRGRFVNNICANNGWKEQWVSPQVGLWNNGKVENFIVANNDVWGNVKGNYENMTDLTGQYGNISADPLFASDGDYHLQAQSPCSQAGSPLLSEGDGSVSDMGMYGGPCAR
jgi:hypothetical protein